LYNPYVNINFWIAQCKNVKIEILLYIGVEEKNGGVGKKLLIHEVKVFSLRTSMTFAFSNLIIGIIVVFILFIFIFYWYFYYYFLDN